MEENKDVVQDSSPEAEVEIVKEDVKIPTESAQQPKTEEKVVPYERFKQVNEELAKLKKQPVKADKSLDVEDYIDISASLEGLDQREKEKLAREHKLTGRPLSEIRKDEDFQMWQESYHRKLEKELTLKPNGAQTDSDRPKTLTERLAATTSMVEKEKILTEAGMYKSPRPRADRTGIGSNGLR